MWTAQSSDRVHRNKCLTFAKSANVMHVDSSPVTPQTRIAVRTWLQCVDMFISVIANKTPPSQESNNGPYQGSHIPGPNRHGLTLTSMPSVFSHLRLVLPISSYPFDYNFTYITDHPFICYPFLSSHRLFLISLIIFGEMYKLLSSLTVAISI